MNDLIQAEATLARHIELCDETYALLLEENSQLQRSGESTAEALLQRKRELLPHLQESLEGLKAMRSKFQGGLRSSAMDEKISRAARKLMKIFLIDRENEQLLLKTAISGSPSQKKVYRSIAKGGLRAAYGRRSSPE